jgi:hypothetical protein
MIEPAQGIGLQPGNAQSINAACMQQDARVQRMNKLSASVRAWATDVNNNEENVWTLGSTR